MNLARPGTAVLVRAGTYHEKVKFPSRQGGTRAAPIWIISADGLGAAKIVAPQGAKAAIQGLGVHNVAIIGFDISAAENGIQFGMSGDYTAGDDTIWSTPHATVDRILVQGNRVHGANPGDGIKISQGENIEISDNIISDVADQCVDFVAVNKGAITRNDCSGSRKAAGIFAKAGSKDVEISHNFVHDIIAPKVAGISLGGWSGPEVFSRPGQRDFEARHVAMFANRVEHIAGYPLVVLGAQNSDIRDNVLDASGSSMPGVVGISHGKPEQAWAWPHDISFVDNVLRGRPSLFQFDKSKDRNGRANIDATRDHIIIQAASAHGHAAPATGPRPFLPWKGQRAYPVEPHDAADHL